MATHATPAQIQHHLPERLWKTAQEYTIPVNFLENMSDLIELVLDSRSMSKPEEKQSWFNLLPLMSDEQIAKLRDILVREKNKLLEIEEKYEDKKLDIKKKYVNKREAQQTQEHKQALKQREQAHREKELEEAEDLLENI